MGYERKELQILGGGFNLLPPGDKVPRTDYLLAQNWRVDREGKLVSRAGYVWKDLALPAANVSYMHSAALFGGEIYAAGNYLITGLGFLVFRGVVIAVGLSGNRLSMVPMNGWMWVMDRLQTGKFTLASGFIPWGLEAPTVSCGSFTGAANADGPNGTYQVYVTFATDDGSVESNPGDPLEVTVDHADLSLFVPLSPEAQVGVRNIYATGGQLGQAYLIGTINDNTTRWAVFNSADYEATSAGNKPYTTQLPAWNDASATAQGIVMPTTNDPPPLGNGMAGPYFGRLLAWKGNRLYWTDPNRPQYWPGSGDAATGNWADVGPDGEDIVWVTLHAGVAVIYKDRSIWRLVGDPDTGRLEQMDAGVGLVNAFAVANAGSVDYFAGPGGIYRNDLDHVREISGPVLPLLQAGLANAGALTPPGSVAEVGIYGLAGYAYYDIRLGFALGKLYVAYREKSTGTPQAAPMLVWNGERWMYHRSTSLMGGVHGFIFDGISMMGLGGASGAGVAYNLDDFLSGNTADNSPTVAVPIECVYQSHHEDCGLPDNVKVWLEVAIDYELAGDTAKVYFDFDGGRYPLNPDLPNGTLTVAGRRTTRFSLSSGGGGSKTISILVYCQAQYLVIVHNVYLYYYVEARQAVAVTSIPVDLGSPKVKQAKELELDIDASNGDVNSTIESDLPGNYLQTRHTRNIPRSNGRSVMKIPFFQAEGYLWRITLAALQPFRVYSARLLVRVVGVYVEAYEAAAGFVWDSMELTFDSGLTKIPSLYQIAQASLPIKRAREICLEIETFSGNVWASLSSDLPGNEMRIRSTKIVNTGAAGRRFVRIPLPAGMAEPIEGRMFRLQLAGAAKFILYDAAIEIMAVGVYVEAYEAAAGAVYDSREVDFGTPGVKEARELELDIETSGAVQAQVVSDITGPFTASVTTTGRQKTLIPLTVNAAAEQFLEGRLLRLILSGTSAFRLYGARLKVRPFGEYVVAGGLWDSTPNDLGTQGVKQLRELEVDLCAYGACTVSVYTDLPGNTMVARNAYTVAATGGRRKVQIPLPQGTVPDNYLFGRLIRVTITSAGALKLFGARIHARPIGVYVESYEAAGGAVWDSTPADLGSANDKNFDQVRFEMDSDAACALAVYTDLPGEAFASRGSFTLTAGASGRHWATVPLTPGTEGRSIRLVVSSLGGFRIYKAQVRAGRVGRYLSGGADALNTLEFDFRSERLKLYKKIQIDLAADAVTPLTVMTDQTGTLAVAHSTGLTTPTGRKTIVVTLPPGIRGRLLRLILQGGPARVYHLRVWTRPLNEPDAPWAWADYPLEESDVLPSWFDLPVTATPPEFAWADLPVPPTSPESQWAPLPVNPTEPAWFWAKVLSVDETPDTWQWVDVPVGI